MKKLLTGSVTALSMAASAAFAGKNVEALTALERNCVGRDDILKTVQNYKAKLIGAAASSVWRN